MSSTFYDAWLHAEKVKIDLLKQILIEIKAQSGFIVEIYNNPSEEDISKDIEKFNQSKKALSEHLKNYLFSEYGEVDLSEILGDSPEK